MIDVIKALAGWEAVVEINAFQSADSEEHSNGGSKRKKGLWLERQLWVINGYLQREGFISLIKPPK